MDDSIRLLHLYAQPAWHDDAWIVGNRAGLKALAQAIQNALASNEGRAEVMVADGEGYTLKVHLDNSEWQSQSWVKRAEPYTNEIACEQRQDAVWPGEAGTVRSG